MESNGLGLRGNKSDIEYKIIHMNEKKYLIANYLFKMRFVQSTNFVGAIVNKCCLRQEILIPGNI